MDASPVHSQRRLIVAPAEPAAAVKPVLPSRSMVGLATLTRSIGVRIPGGQPIQFLQRYPSRGSNPWGATNGITVSGPENGKLPR